MRKQFKKGVAILSAVSMVAAGISYVPQNVKADAPVIAVQDSEEGVDYSSLTYTKAEPNGGGEFPELYYSVITDELHANVGYFDAGATFQFAYSADNKQEDTKITVNGVETEPGAGVVSMYISGLTKLNPKAMEDNAYTHVVITSTTGKLEIVFKKGTPASSDTTTTTTTEPTTTTTEPTTTTTTTTTTEAPEVTTPAKVPGLTYAGNETLPFYFAWQGVAGANGYNVYLDGKLITKVDGVTYEFSKDLFAEAREYIIEVAAVNEAGEGIKAEYKYTVESKEPDSTKNEETDSTKNEETDSTKNEESNSSSSTEEDVKVPVAVTGLAYTGTEEASFKFSWDASEGAESYNVYLNDKFVTSTVTPEYSFDSALFEKAGTYTISVEAVNKAGKSDKTSIEYVVKEPASSESTDESKDPQPSSTDESKDPQQSSTDESKDDNTEVTMPSDYTAFENNADFGYKFVSAPEAAKAEVKTDQGENLFIAFKAVEGFYPDYTGLKVNGTDVDVAKGAGITLPKSLLTKKVNEVVILDKDGKEVVLNVFNVNGEGEIPTSPSVTEPDASTPDVSTPDASTPDASTPDASTPDVSTPDVSTPDASTPDVSTPDASTPDVSTPDASTPDASTPDVTQPDVTTPDAITTSTEKVTETSTKEDVETTPDSGKDESTAKPTTPKVTTAKPTVKPTTAKPTTKKASLKKTKITKKITKKLSSKKVKLTFKKVKGAKKYTVQVSTSKKFKKVLYKKTVKKTKVTLSSKKFKGKKKLYVRVKAVGAKKWSKAVKIKVK